MIKEYLKSRNLILASKSPRRQELLKSIGVPFEIRSNNIEEVYPKNLVHHEISDYLAVLKADPFKKNLYPVDLLITSDTIVWHQNNAIGKPKSTEDALEILQNLSGSTHEVITSVCLTSMKKQILIHCCSNVTFKILKKKEIIYYINNFNTTDKSGAYGIQEWIGKIGIEKIEGCYYNVMGFPINIVYENLLKF